MRVPSLTGDVVCSGFPGYDVCSGLRGMVFVPGLRGLDSRGLSNIVCLEFLIRIVKARVLLHVFLENYHEVVAQPNLKDCITQLQRLSSKRCLQKWDQTLIKKNIHTYLIGHSPLGLFRANETNN